MPELGPDEQKPPAVSGGGRRVRIAGILIGLVVLFGLWFARLQQPPEAETTIWQLQNSGQLFRWLSELALAALLDASLFAVVGFLAALATGPSTTRRGALARGALALLIGLGLAGAIRSLDTGHFPDPLRLVPPSAACLLGVGIGCFWLRGRRARQWLVLQLAIFLLISGGLGAGLMALAVDHAPLDFHPAQVTSAEKRRLVELVRDSPTGSRAGIETRELHLEQQDVNLLLSWGLAVGCCRRKVQVQLAPNEIAALVATKLPSRGKEPRYLNLQVAGRLAVDAGKLKLQIEQFRLGRLQAPGWVLKRISPAAVAAIEGRPAGQQILSCVESLQIDAGAVEIVFRKGKFSNHVLPALLGPDREVLLATRAQMIHLFAVAEQLPGTNAPLENYLEAAFALARERSQKSDPVLENQAAIFALAILLGHPRVEDLLGPVTDEEMWPSGRPRVQPARLRGRRDWTRHFCVSAALALLSDETVSDAIGLLKEEMDAGEGGSGFSFSDLLADRAGTMFASAATRDEKAARAMQERLTGGFHVDAIFPPAADLPEGLSDDQLQSDYGGVGGAGYRALEAEIERRLAACAALR